MIVLDFHLFERGVTLDVNKQSLPLVLVTVQSKTKTKENLIINSVNIYSSELC